MNVFNRYSIMLVVGLLMIGVAFGGYSGYLPYFKFTTSGSDIGDFSLGETGLFYDYSTNSTDINDLDVATNLDVAGTCSITGNVNVDSGVLYVDTSSNEVGIGTTSPSAKLAVIGDVEINGFINYG